ncbi:hypothetical protein Scep_024089 [Stephania cephalantha]|uniref:Uncharacterized protein n=1 Tax=Stephania cephalantha TaxID=152367 RepID=A0AAP0F4U3_9MAGN
MAFVVRSARVPPNSATFEEARQRTLEFFRKACRSIPTIMQIHNLEDVVTISQLRSTISSEILKRAHITNPKDPPRRGGDSLPTSPDGANDGGNFIPTMQSGAGALKEGKTDKRVVLFETIVVYTTNTSMRTTYGYFDMVIDMLLFKGFEELNNILEQAKQRHHLIGQYVIGREGLVQDHRTKDQGISDFLKNFYSSNYF